MIKTYNDAVHWIHSRLKFGIKPGLKRMDWMLDRLGNPQRNISAIHIAGTNGKGSTLTFLRNIFEEAGYSVGTFTSPYIEIFNERISVNGIPINDNDLLDLVNIIKPLADELDNHELGSPTEFEIITAMSFVYFGTINKQDFVIYEVGLGGRLDSTNVVEPILTAITNIGYDHINILGKTLEEIAYEKAGIIKEKIPVISTINQEVCRDIVKKIAKNNNSDVCFVNDAVEGNSSDGTGESFSIKLNDGTRSYYSIKMDGLHQIMNASLAVYCAKNLVNRKVANIEEIHIKKGLQKSFWIGRFEKVSNNPLIIIDGAHNIDGINIFVDTIQRKYSSKKKNILFAAVNDKEYSVMLEKLKNVAEELTVTTFDFYRAASAEELYHSIENKKNVSINSDWKSWITNVLQNGEEDGVFFITGSLYFISDVRKWILKELNNK
ncbi:MAG: bifunctional folylpolyglutamate synthase/dihydrofolate synthase [Bacillales bacterium]|jgi:dihydrofolate synthase/folylpolyglutamate synthase|nr:bifunctional folylpolyglutamate synthase/dihydrofolate synthase [Bacillales bacterium]